MNYSPKTKTPRYLQKQGKFALRAHPDKPVSLMKQKEVVKPTTFSRNALNRLLNQENASILNYRHRTSKELTYNKRKI